MSDTSWSIFVLVCGKSLADLCVRQSGAIFASLQVIRFFPCNISKPDRIRTGTVPVSTKLWSQSRWSRNFFFHWARAKIFVMAIYWYRFRYSVVDPLCCLPVPLLVPKHCCGFGSARSKLIVETGSRTIDHIKIPVPDTWSKLLHTGNFVMLIKKS
jgi:hypothetical protein